MDTNEINNLKLDWIGLDWIESNPIESNRIRSDQIKPACICSVRSNNVVDGDNHTTTTISQRTGGFIRLVHVNGRGWW